MNKAELLAYLLAKEQIIVLGTEQLIEVVHNYNKYIVNAVVKNTDNAITMQNIGFYEDISSSDCWFMNQEPFAERPITFQEEVNIKIQELIDTDIIEIGIITNCSEQLQRAFVVVAKKDKKKAEFVIFKKSDDSLDYIEVD